MEIVMTTDHFDPEQLAATVRETSCILVVDDDSRVRWTVERQLKTVRAEVVIVESADEALRQLRTKEVSVLLTDQRMPGMSGTELLSVVREEFPKVVRIMMTGDNDLHTAVGAINAGEVFRFLMKPWSMADLHQVVKAGLSHYFAQKERELFASELERANDMLQGDNEALEQLVQQRTAELHEQARLLAVANEQLEGSLAASLEMLGAMSALGNHRVGEHCDRTRERVTQLSKSLEIPDDLRRDLELAAQYHWLGLLAAPPVIFEKESSRFDPDLAAIWEFHPTLSALVLSPVAALERPAMIIESYLSDLKPPEEDLALAAQILRCCSVFERTKAIADVDTGIERLWALAEGSVEHEIVARLVRMIQEEIAPGERLLDSATDLEVGMVLARMVTTYSGLPMEPAFRAATPELIERLRAIDERVGLGEIWVRDE